MTYSEHGILFHCHFLIFAVIICSGPTAITCKFQVKERGNRFPTCVAISGTRHCCQLNQNMKYHTICCSFTRLFNVTLWRPFLSNVYHKLNKDICTLCPSRLPSLAVKWNSSWSLALGRVMRARSVKSGFIIFGASPAPQSRPGSLAQSFCALLGSGQAQILICSPMYNSTSTFSYHRVFKRD